MKTFKIISINILIFFVIFHVADYYAFMKYNQWLYNMYPENKIISYLKHYKFFHNYSLNSDKYTNNRYNNLVGDTYGIKGKEPKFWEFRPIENEFATNSIILFGCSFTYGLYLKEDETISARLGKSLSNYRIYNRSKCGWSTSHMLYQLENKDFSDIPNVKFVIYVFIKDHFIRNAYSNIPYYAPYYQLTKAGSLEFQKYSLKYIDIPLSYILKDVYNNIFYNYLCNDGKYKRIELTKKILEKSESEVSQKFPEATFIILRYDNGEDESYNQMFEELKNKGIVVVSLKDLSNKNYLDLPYQTSKTDRHPKAKAWEEITPLFVKYLTNKGA